MFVFPNTVVYFKWSEKRLWSKWVSRVNIKLSAADDSDKWDSGRTDCDDVIVVATNASPIISTYRFLSNTRYTVFGQVESLPYREHVSHANCVSSLYNQLDATSPILLFFVLPMMAYIVVSISLFLSDFNVETFEVSRIIYDFKRLWRKLNFSIRCAFTSSDNSIDSLLNRTNQRRCSYKSRRDYACVAVAVWIWESTKPCEK